MTNKIKACANCKENFVIEPDDFSFYEKIGVPPPTFCPDCRFQRRLLFRNERNYYRRKCDLCGKSIIACYPADTPFPVYCVKCWWGDGWDPHSYGRDVDFSKPFLEQVKELFQTVPVLAIQNDNGIGSVNAEWSYDWAFSKNVYLCVCGWYTENTLYGYYLCYDRDVMDSYFVNNSELMYECVNCDKGYNCKHCTLCFGCSDCTLGYDLRGCQNCTMCVGLRNKQYCILNQQYTKEEYEKKLEELNLGNRSNFAKHKKEFDELVMKMPRKYAYNLKTLNSTGDLMIEAKNVKNCFYVIGPTENCRYFVSNDRARECYDCNNSGNPELCYESVTPDNSKGSKFTIYCWKSTDAEYSNNCHSCTGVFGSTGLKHSSYSILNKKYSKEDYKKLRDQIVEHMKKNGEWGEFFPRELSPFAYDETAAIEWFPLTQNEVLEKGHRWKGMEKRDYQATKKIGELPENIDEVDDSILGEIIECAHKGECNERCTTAFRIVDAELKLYRRFGVPLPTLCPNCRHYERLKVRNPAKLWHRKCHCTGEGSDNKIYSNKAEHFHGKEHCPNEFETSYAPDRPEIVYCETCYNAEIV